MPGKVSITTLSITGILVYTRPDVHEVIVQGARTLGAGWTHWRLERPFVFGLEFGYVHRVV